MTRTRTSLDGPWEFQIDPAGAATPAHLTEWRTVPVPSPWQATADDLRHTSGVGWYRRRLQVPPGDGAAILHFGAVDHRATVWIDGHLVGDHEGGYLPFELEVSDHLTGDAELLVRVEDPTDDDQRYRSGVFSEIPHGKQSWYGPLSGIWQPVWLEQRSRTHVRSLRLQPDLVSGRLGVIATLSQPAPTATRLRLRVGGDASAEVVVPEGAHQVEAALHVPDPRPWSPETPHLYDVHADLLADGEVIDELVERTGFRTIEAVDGQLLLNGEPLLLRAALDQDYYPGTIATVPSLEVLEDQARRAKELGLNCLRCHIKVPDPRYLEVADRVGLLVWAELPNWRRLSAAAGQLARETFAGMVERDANHPSIVAWTIVNEDWGTDLVGEAEHRRWLQETYRWAKQLDPTRLVVDNSACPPNFHVETDLEDYHFYRAMPDRRDEWDEFVDRFAERREATFSPHGDAVRTGNEPLVVSEFGSWGLPDPDLLVDADGRDPWWFTTGDEWESGIVRPQGVRERFATWHLGAVFGDLPAFVEATQWQQFRAVKSQIESMRRRPEIAGYVITELTDTHWEPNGLLDAHRRPKAFHNEMAAVCADTVIAPRWERTSYVGSETARLAVVVATGAHPLPEEALLRWRLASGTSSGVVPVVPLGATDAKEIAELEVPLPPGPTVDRLHLQLEARGRTIARSHLDLSVHTAVVPTDDGPLLWSPDQAVADHLQAAGYLMADAAERSDVVVAVGADDAVVSHVRRGGRALVLVDRAGPLHPALPGLGAVDRRGSVWDGDWASTFAWLRREQRTASLPGGPLLDESFERIIPERVLTGVEPWEFEVDVLAGLVAGWIHRPVALAVRRRYGRGVALATTFRLLRDAPGADPTAATLLDALLRTCADARTDEGP
jgi:hypothetical protein